MYTSLLGVGVAADKHIEAPEQPFGHAQQQMYLPECFQWTVASIVHMPMFVA